MRAMSPFVYALREAQSIRIAWKNLLSGLQYRLRRHNMLKSQGERTEDGEVVDYVAAESAGLSTELTPLCDSNSLRFAS